MIQKNTLQRFSLIFLWLLSCFHCSLYTMDLHRDHDLLTGITVRPEVPTCPICLEPVSLTIVNNPQLAAIHGNQLFGGNNMPCSTNHIYHTHCIQLWIQARVAANFLPTCPICRSPMNPLSQDWSQELAPLLSSELSEVLIAATISNDLAYVQWLVTHGANIHARGDLAVFIATVNGNHDIAHYLCEHGGFRTKLARFKVYWPIRTIIVSMIIGTATGWYFILR